MGGFGAAAAFGFAREFPCGRAASSGPLFTTGGGPETLLVVFGPDFPAFGRNSP
jgi:hypothetical protein